MIYKLSLKNNGVEVKTWYDDDVRKLFAIERKLSERFVTHRDARVLSTYSTHVESLETEGFDLHDVYLYKLNCTLPIDFEEDALNNVCWSMYDVTPWDIDSTKNKIASINSRYSYCIIDVIVTASNVKDAANVAQALLIKNINSIKETLGFEA